MSNDTQKQTASSGDGNAAPTVVQQATVLPSLSNDPQGQTVSANSRREEAGAAVNMQADNAATVLASMLQQPPPSPPFTMATLRGTM